MFLAAKFGLVDPGPTFFFQIFNTLVLFGGLSFVLFKPMTEFLEKRSAGIAKNISDAEQRIADAEQLKNEYKEKLGKIHEEELRIMKEAKQRADERAHELRKLADKEIHAMKEAANREIEAEKSRALNELKDEIASIAMMAATQIVGKSIDGAGHENLIDEFIHKVGDSKWQN